jgi:hypothetical protein
MAEIHGVHLPYDRWCAFRFAADNSKTKVLCFATAMMSADLQAMLMFIISQ